MKVNGTAVNVYISLRQGKRAGPNPWSATTLEWQTPQTPPKHGNWGAEVPSVYRWAYDYSVPGAKQDFLPQNLPHDKAEKDIGSEEKAL